MKGFLLLVSVSLLVQLSSTAQTHRICVPESAKDACERMVTEGVKQNVHMTCIVGRDRLDCLEKIHQHLADFGVMEPEDMYIASNIGNKDFQIFKEIRTKEEPDAEFRYKAVAVIRKDLNIKNISSLRGLNSCHTGVGRNVGYKIPITKLTKFKVLDPLSDTSISPRENELKVLSEFFKKACLVGKWAPDNSTNRELKTKYSNLCSLCEHPDICDYPDQNSGYEGALRCLTNAGGDVAWTKTIYVNKYFGLKDSEKKNHAEDYAFLCPDGTKVPINQIPCAWAARPWPGYISDSNLTDISELREEIFRLNKLGEALSADWFNMVLQLSDKTVTVNNAHILHPYEYLSKAKYYDVIGRDVVIPRRTIRWCVTSKAAHNKCKALKIAAYSRDIRPEFECVEEINIEKCLQTIRDNGADIITVDATEAVNAQSNYNMKIIATETYNNSADVYAVALVRSDSPYKTFEDLRGKKSCHTAYMRSTGWVAPVQTLLDRHLIEKDNCPYLNAVSAFFSGGSCIPNIPEELKANSTSTSICSSGSKNTEEYKGPLSCLISGDGDVAFTKHIKIIKALKDGEIKQVELLCPNGGRASVDQYLTCNLGQVPPHVVITNNQKTDVELNEINNALLATANLYGNQPDLFKLFGKYNGEDDLLFLNPTTGLQLYNEELFKKVNDQYKTMLSNVQYCDQKVNRGAMQVSEIFQKQMAVSHLRIEYCKLITE